MDNWFRDLFDIVKKQKDPMKLELLMPKIYSEFDILVRDRDISELQEIYNYINDNDFFSTIDSSQNKIIKLQCKQEILFRLVLLDDFTMLNKSVDELIDKANPQIINSYLDSWKHKSFIHDYIKKRINSSKPEKIIIKPSNIKQSIEKKKPEKVETKKDKPIEKKKSDSKIKLTIREKPKAAIKPIIKEKPVIPNKETIQEKESIPVVVSKKETDIPVINKQKIVKTNVVKKDNDFIEFIDIIDKQYPIIINKEKLLNLTNPQLAFYRIVSEYIDSETRDIDFFIKLIDLSILNNCLDLVHFTAQKSKALRHVASFNIAFLNEPDINKCEKLLTLLKNEKVDYINTSLNEIRLLTFIDDLYQGDEITNEIILETKKVARFVPKVTDIYQHTESMDFFIKNIFSLKTRTIDMTNLNHLYWSMILATYLGAYVHKQNESDYIKCMETVTDVSLQLSIHIKDSSIKAILKELAISYIRKIYKAGITSPNYDSWWVRQVNDLRDSKIDCLSKLEKITEIDLNY